jgi:Ca2+-binding EF-hand superfamily protein
MRASKPLLTAAILSLALTGPAAMAKGNQKPNQNNNGGGEDLTHMRFAEMDTNHDGQITRAEWRGNSTSFNQHDWNGDGVLSGIEVTPGAQRPVDFNSLDRNRDGRISLSEWTGNRLLFNLLDLNQDGFLSHTEFGPNGALFASRRLEDLFRGLDVNRDNRISRTEWPASGVALFDRLDTNRDTFLSWDEFRRIGSLQGNDPGNHLEALFNALDANHDGRLSPAEWPADRALFDRLDANRDGFLTLEEARQGLANLGDDDDDDDQGEVERAFNKLDTNHDNRISRSEWRGNKRNFDRLDTNRDGFLTLEEFGRGR